MPKKARYAQAKEDFKLRYSVDPKTKCWVWKNTAFRFRVGSHIHNPRRFAIYASGKMIPVGRQVACGCGNERCVNPNHAILRHSGMPIPDHVPFYIEIPDMHLGSSYLRHRYLRTMDEMREARIETLQMIVRIRHTRGSIEEVTRELDVSPAFVYAARSLSVQDFNSLKTDPYDTGGPDDYIQEDVPDDAHLFNMDGAM